MRIEKFIKQVKSEARTGEAARCIPGDTLQTQKSNVSIVLSKLETPKFRRDLKEYQGFMEYFDAAIAMYNINDVQKFFYLKIYLVEETQEVVLVLVLTKANYGVVREALRGKKIRRQEIQ